MKVPLAALLLFMAATALAPLTSLSAVGGGDIEFKPKGAGVVLFKHELHVNKKGMKCADCHYNTFQKGGTSYKFDMSVLTKGAFCGKCHDGNKAFDLKDANSCARCHKD